MGDFNTSYDLLIYWAVGHNETMDGFATASGQTAEMRWGSRSPREGSVRARPRARRRSRYGKCCSPNLLLSACRGSGRPAEADETLGSK